MWKFTLLWTLAVIGSIHFLCGLIAGIVFSRRHPLIAISIPFIATTIGILMALISSTVVGEFARRRDGGAGEGKEQLG